jgi:cation diffusion facilitator family transporter
MSAPHHADPPDLHDETRVLETEHGLVALSIFEEGVPPRFRIHFTDAVGRPQTPPADAQVTVETLRAPALRHQFQFLPQPGGYLEATELLPEPHEFGAVFTLTQDGHSHSYQLQFVEHDHHHAHGGHDHGPHGHTHGVVDPSIASSERGLWAIKWSFVALLATAVLQAAAVALSGSVALLADTIHNVGDAATAIPLGIAFLFARRRPTTRFSFGYGKVEDLAGVAIVLTILISAIVAGYESIDRLLHPRPIEFLGAVALASLVGFLGNEGVAVFRLRVGKEIGSAALVADGYHARTDGWTSLAVLAGALGVWLGFPLADPLIGLGITVAILGIVWQSTKAVGTRMLDGVDPQVIEEVRHAALHVPGVEDVTEVRARWIGHRLAVEANVAVDPQLSVGDGHAIAAEVNHQLRHQLGFVSLATIHVDPVHSSGETHHLQEHAHDGLPVHSH